MANKVKFGLSNCYYAVLDETTTPATYGTPAALPGAVNLSLSQEGDTNKFRADNIDYYVSISNNGYSGELELALVPDAFLKNVMGETVNTATGLQYESADAKPKAFALMFQFEGDTTATRHVLYYCKASRPDVASQTTGDTIEPVTETVSLTATARVITINSVDVPIVKAKCDETATTTYNAFFSTVQLPT